MSNKLPLSVFIIAHNEADRIERTMNSVREWVDEIIVVDSGSNDGTPQKAEALDAKVFFNAWAGYGPQKRFAEEKCSHAWLLNLDADEVISPALMEEIKALFAQGAPAPNREEDIVGYVLDVRDLLPGETKLAPFAHTNRCLRLYYKQFARFADSTVHDSVIVQRGRTAALKQPVYHYSFRSLGHAVEKMNAYTAMQAEDLVRRGKTAKSWRLAVEFPFAFLKCYLLRMYILRGMRGFEYAVLYATGRLLRLAKARELQLKK